MKICHYSHVTLHINLHIRTKNSIVLIIKFLVHHSFEIAPTKISMLDNPFDDVYHYKLPISSPIYVLNMYMIIFLYFH